MKESERQQRRSGWLWLWIAFFVVAVMLILFWAWPARQPPADGTERGPTTEEVSQAPGTDQMSRERPSGTVGSIG